jgi:hypothetical protein
LLSAGCTLESKKVLEAHDRNDDAVPRKGNY